MNVIRFIFGATILLAPTFSRPQELTKRWADYYPLAKGNSWTYSVTGKSKARTVVWKVVNVQANASGPIFAVWPTPLPADDSGMNLQFSPEGLRELSDDFFVLRFPLKKGSTWSNEQDREFVVVSEGQQCVVGKLNFRMCAVVRDDDKTAKLRTMTTYAYGVGPVRYEYYKLVSGGFASEATQQLELVSYSVMPSAADSKSKSR